MANGGKPPALCVDAALHQLLGGLAKDVVVDTQAVARLAAQQLIDRYPEVLAGDVPEGDVDGAEGAHDGRAAKVARAVEVLPVMLDPQRVLADQVGRELVDDGLARLEVAPGARFAQSHDALIGLDLDEQVTVDRNRLDPNDFHR